MFIASEIMKWIPLFLLVLMFSCDSKESVKIGIQPYGQFDSTLVDSVQAVVKRVYGFEAIILPRKELPKSAFANIKSPRYRADSLIKQMKESCPDSLGLILGLTTKDISTTKRDADGEVLKPQSKYQDWGVFGLGYRPGKSCIVSTFRIHSDSQKQFESRFKKIVMHEIGHNLGLKHCDRNEKCVMQDAAETIKTVDRVELKLCAYCQNKIE